MNEIVDLAITLHHVGQFFIVHKMYTFPRIRTHTLSKQRNWTKNRNPRWNRGREWEKITFASRNLTYASPRVPAGKRFKWLKPTVFELINGRSLLRATVSDLTLAWYYNSDDYRKICLPSGSSNIFLRMYWRAWYAVVSPKVAMNSVSYTTNALKYKLIHLQKIHGTYHR